MNRSHLGLLFTALLIVVFGSACGTNTPTVMPTAPTAADIPLPLSYTSVNGSQSVSYPQGWVVEEQAGLIALANNDATMRTVVAQGSLTSGQAGLIIVPFSANTVALMGEGGDPTNAPTTATEFARILSTRVSTGTPSEITSLTINDKDAAYVTLILDSGDSLAIIVDAGGGAYVLLQGATASGELAQFQDTFFAIAGTLTFTPQSSPTSEVTPEATP